MEVRSKDYQDLIGLTTTTHLPEVRVCLPLSRVYEVVLVWRRCPRWQQINNNKRVQGDKGKLVSEIEYVGTKVGIEDCGG